MSRVGTRACFFAGAIVIGALVVAPPFDRLADSSFAWHMGQHLALLYVVTLLVLLARPFDVFCALAGKRAVAATVQSTRPLHVLANPAVALLVLVGTLWLTHFSGFYESALEHPWMHVGEHALYLAAGTIFWLPVLAPPPIRPPSYPARLLYLALALPQGAFLGMVIASARAPLYAHYTAALGSAGRALADQRNAGALMWIAGGLIVFAAFLVTFGAWAHRESTEAPEPARVTR